MIAATMPTAVQELYAQFLSLSPQEQAVFLAHVESTPADRDRRDQAVLEHRDRLVAEGLTQYVPWEQAKQEMRAKLGLR